MLKKYVANDKTRFVTVVASCHFLVFYPAIQYNLVFGTTR